MLEDIRAVIENYQKNSFTGQIKFGIEKSGVKCITIIQADYKGVSQDAEEFYKKIAISNHGNFFGSISVCMSNGEIIETTIQESIQGENVKKTIQHCKEIRKCRSVRIAVKKLDTLH